MIEQATEEIKYVPLVATPLKNGEEPIVLNKEMYNSLYALLKSYDEENHKLAQLSINACDIQKSIYWLWKLARQTGSYRMVNLRTKASRYFRDNSDLFKIATMYPTNFAKHLYDKNWLTTEIYQSLEKDLIEEAFDDTENLFFDVTLTIKDKYKHLVTINTINKKEYENGSNK